MNIHLVAYGDDTYLHQREAFKESAIKSSFFDEIHLFTPADIDPVFYNNIYEPIKSQRGGGYWIWKPYFVKKMMDSIENGDVLIYCDSGCTINPEGGKRFEEYIAFLLSSYTGTVDFRLQWWEYQYTKKEVFEHFDVSDEIINSAQLHSTVLILKKCRHAIKVVDEWYNTAVNHSNLFTDKKGGGQHPHFIDHRHDQSIFSIVRKMYGANIVGDEVCYGSFDEFRHLPFWSTRFIG